MGTPVYMINLDPGSLPRINFREDIDLSAVVGYRGAIGREHARYWYLIPLMETLTVLFDPKSSGYSAFYREVQRVLRLRIAACPQADDLVALVQWRNPCTYVGLSPDGQGTVIGIPSIWVGRESDLHPENSEWSICAHGLKKRLDSYEEVPFTWGEDEFMNRSDVIYCAEV